MFKLLKKELTLSINPQTIIFSLLVLMIAIPSWPAAIGFMYPLSGLMVIFPLALANHDIEYTALLPIKKGDIVKSKVLFIVFVELATILISIPAALLRNFVITPPMIEAAKEAAELAEEATSDASYYASVGPTFISYGTILLGYSIFNIILIPQYYKNPYKKITGPQLISMFTMLIVLGIGTGAQVLLYNIGGLAYLIGTIITVSLGVILYALLTIVAEKRGEKQIYKIDL